MSASQLVNLIQLSNGNLRIEIVGDNKTKQGLRVYEQAQDEIIELHKRYKNTAYSDLAEILEYWFCNDSYELLNQFDYKAIGALTSAPIIGYEVDRDDEGNLQGAQKTWWYMLYQLKDPVEQLLKDGYVIFESGEE